MEPQATVAVPTSAEAETKPMPSAAPGGAAGSAESAGGGKPANFDLPALQSLDAATNEASGGDPERNIELLQDVTLRVKIELGRGRMILRDVLRLAEGSVVELEKLAGDPLDIYVNDRLIGKGEVLVLNENFCVRITQVFSPEECLRIKGIA